MYSWNISLKAPVLLSVCFPHTCLVFILEVRDFPQKHRPCSSLLPDSVRKAFSRTDPRPLPSCARSLHFAQAVHVALFSCLYSARHRLLFLLLECMPSRIYLWFPPLKNELLKFYFLYVGAYVDISLCRWDWKIYISVVLCNPWVLNKDSFLSPGCRTY